MNQGEPKSWLVGATGYEIYTRSFQDTNADGYGDIEGIRQRLDYLQWLGTDILWLTPIYPSPDFDHGYDVSDYLNVRPDHGTVGDVEALVAAAHERDMRVILDIVPNHTSWDHEWFKKALADPTSEERDMYLFRDPAPDGGPPNNWLSHFGGPAWTLDETSGQYWLHLFVKQQPDLNWRNERVRDEFDNIYRFWFDRGVDGFRIDVAHGLLKDPSFADNPKIRDVAPDAGPMEIFFSYEHRYDMDQDDNVEIFTRWQNIASEYGVVLLAESGVYDPHRLARYVGPGALDLTFYLKPPNSRWDPATIINDHLTLAEIEPHKVSWVISNHDVARPVSRYTESLTTSDVERLSIGRRRSLCVTTFTFALGGVPFLYYGEELGLPNGIVDPRHREDPIATLNTTGASEARDVARTPMPWDGSQFNGFSTVQPWIHSQDRPDTETVDFETNSSESIVHRYRQLLAVRKANPDLFEAPLIIEPAPTDEVAVVRRGAIVTVANLSAEATKIALDGSLTVIFVSDPALSPTDVAIDDDGVVVPAETTLFIRVGAGSP